MNKLEITKAQEKQLITAMEHDKDVFTEILEDIKWSVRYAVTAVVLTFVAVFNALASDNFRLTFVAILFSFICHLISNWFHRRAHKREDQLEFPKVFDELIGDKIRDDFKTFMKRYIDE